MLEYVQDKQPFLFEVNPFMCSSQHQVSAATLVIWFKFAPLPPSLLVQAVAFLPKVLCDVRRVEIARAVRLLGDSLEPVFFTVPRAKVPAQRCFNLVLSVSLSPSARVLPG